MVNLFPALSLQVHCYPECTAEVKPLYTGREVEMRTRSRHDIWH